MATSYSNTGGTGDRTPWLMIDVGTLLSAGTANNIISASQANSLAFGFAGVSGKALIFDFGNIRVIDEAKWYQNLNTNGGGVWKWQGSTDGTTYTDIGSSFTLGGSATQTQTQLSGNTIAYRYYKLLGVSGSTNDTNVGYMIEFKIDTGNLREYFNTYGSGDRTASITVTQASILSGTPLSNLVRSNLLTSAGITFVSHALTSADIIQFQFPDARIVDEVTLSQDVSTSASTWKLQGSSNGSSWVDVGTSAVFSSIVAKFLTFTGCNGNTTAYIYYRLIGVSGTPSNTPVLRTFIFRIGANPALPITASDTINNLVDTNSNSGYARTANAQFDYFSFLDSIAIVGGDPFFHVTFGDSLLLQDQLQGFVPKIAKLFSDTINNLTESVVDIIGIPIKAFDSQMFNWAEAMNVRLLAFIGQTPSDTIFNLADSAATLLKTIPILITIADTINFIADAQKIFDRLTAIAGDNFVLSDAIVLRFNHLLKVAEVLTAFLERLGISVKSRPAFSDSFTLSDGASLRLFGQTSITKNDTLALTDHAITAVTGDYNAAGFIDRIRRYLGDTN